MATKTEKPQSALKDGMKKGLKDGMKASKERSAKQIAPEAFDPWAILKFPHLTEKSMNMIERDNKLVFIADRKASKLAIKEAVERGFNVKVSDVNVTITRKGEKKAYVLLTPESNAGEIATRLGMI